MDDLHEEILANAATDSVAGDDTEAQAAPAAAAAAEKSEETPEPISEELFQKAMALLEEEFTVDSLTENDAVADAIAIDTAGFLKGLVSQQDTGFKDLVRAMNIRMSAIGVVLKKSLEKLASIESGLDSYGRAPARSPKGRSQVLEKSFGEDAGIPGANGPGNRGPDDLTKADLKRGFTILMDRAMEKADETGNATELERIGTAAGTFESNGGMINKSWRQRIWKDVFAA